METMGEVAVAQKTSIGQQIASGVILGLGISLGAGFVMTMAMFFSSSAGTTKATKIASTPLITVTLATDKKTIAPGDDFVLSMNISKPPSPRYAFQGIFGDFTSSWIDFTKPANFPSLDLDGTLTSGWLPAQNFCTDPVAPCGINGNVGKLLVAMATAYQGPGGVGSVGTFLKVRIKTMASAPGGSYPLTLSPLNGWLFPEDIPTSSVEIVPTSISIVLPRANPPVKPPQVFE